MNIWEVLSKCLAFLTVGGRAGVVLTCVNLFKSILLYYIFTSMILISIVCHGHSFNTDHSMCQFSTRFIVSPSSIQTTEKVFGAPKGAPATL